MIDLNALTPDDRNRRVIYRDDRLGFEQRGLLTSWNERVAFVRYYTSGGVLGFTAQATNPEDLRWED